MEGLWGRPVTYAPKLKSYQFSQLKFDHTDFRFMTKGELLYAVALGWPDDGTFVITSLAENATNYPQQIGKVELLGGKSDLRWTRSPTGLQIQVPTPPPCKYAYSFRILPA